MTTTDAPEQPHPDTRAAGAFSSWLRSAALAVRGEGTSDVPCDGCSGCCTSSQFVLIGMDETDTLTHIPEALLFAAPGRSEQVLLGYDERGHCPMLADDGRCSIYEHRPQTCRSYDCRVFAATGFEVEDDKPRIVERIRQWSFDHPTRVDRVEHEAVQVAADYLAQRRGELEQVPLPINPTQLAALAIAIHGCFIEHAADSSPSLVAEPPAPAVRAAVERAKASASHQY